MHFLDSRSPQPDAYEQENGYFLCSTLEEHLFDTGGGVFTFGTPISFEMTHGVRSRIYKRIYHIPRGAMVRSRVPLSSYLPLTYPPDTDH